MPPSLLQRETVLGHRVKYPRSRIQSRPIKRQQGARVRARAHADINLRRGSEDTGKQVVGGEVDVTHCRTDGRSAVDKVTFGGRIERRSNNHETGEEDYEGRISHRLDRVRILTIESSSSSSSSFLTGTGQRQKLNW